MDVRCVLIKLKDNSEPLVDHWAQVINERRDEALQTLKDEGVYIESFFLTKIEGNDYLIGYTRVNDIAKAHATAKSSNHAIDEFHKKFKKNAWGERFDTKLLVDLSPS